MPDIYVDSAAILSVAEKIDSLNTSMKLSFDSVTKAIQILDDAWDGSSATNCIAKLREGNTNIKNARYDALNNYVNFLRQSVSTGYENVETANIKLADRFK